MLNLGGNAFSGGPSDSSGHFQGNPQAQPMREVDQAIGFPIRI